MHLCEYSQPLSFQLMRNVPGPQGRLGVRLSRIPRNLPWDCSDVPWAEVEAYMFKCLQCLPVNVDRDLPLKWFQFSVNKSLSLSLFLQLISSCISVNVNQYCIDKC